ncbi:serine/threonine protein phosphatase [Pseudomonas koreensis]|uniref:serine/threonine protein phosphatase n=1 Tax=Pseudomonas koreensis TaxID=198620 RepID=UPI002FC6879D
MRYLSRSITGQASRANNDYAGATCEGDRGFFVVADGTSRRGSGQLAECFVSGMLAAHSTQLEQGGYPAEPGAIERLLGSILSDFHASLPADQTGAICYLIGLVAHGRLTVAYEGDCSCGIVTLLGAIEWITPPHYKANWRRDRSHCELAQDPARNSVTRCLKINRVPNPDFVWCELEAVERLVFVTDGFWADLTQVQQSSLLAAPDSDFSVGDDDVTWIDVQLGRRD